MLARGSAGLINYFLTRGRVEWILVGLVGQKPAHTKTLLAPKYGADSWFQQVSQRSDSTAGSRYSHRAARNGPKVAQKRPSGAGPKGLGPLVKEVVSDRFWARVGLHHDLKPWVPVG